MVEIKVGDVIHVADIKHGEGSRGSYAIGKVKAQKGYDTISVFAVNADSLSFNGVSGMRIAEITSVRKTAHQYGEKWYDDYNVNAKLEPVQDSFPEDSGFQDVPDEDLPF